MKARAALACAAAVGVTGCSDPQPRGFSRVGEPMPYAYPRAEILVRQDGEYSTPEILVLPCTSGEPAEQSRLVDGSCVVTAYRWSTPLSCDYEGTGLVSVTWTDGTSSVTVDDVHVASGFDAWEPGEPLLFEAQFPGASPIVRTLSGPGPAVVTSPEFVPRDGGFLPFASEIVIDRSRDLEVRWTGAEESTADVMLGCMTDPVEYTELRCRAPGALGEVVIPQHVLGYLPSNCEGGSRFVVGTRDAVEGDENGWHFAISALHVGRTADGVDTDARLVIQ